MDGSTSRLPSIPTELWLTIFENVVALKAHIFDQDFHLRLQATRDLLALQYVCKSWRVCILNLYKHESVPHPD
jgi:hypothetical protein